MTSQTSAPKGVVLFLACMAQFMVVLDVAIVNVALPSIQQDLGVGRSTLQWVVVAYGLMLGGFLLLGGRMADLLGRRRVLLTGLALFSAASLFAGLAGSADVLIAARALQGFGAALVPPAALSILAVTFAEGSARNKALGLYGATGGVSASVGVIASGLLTDGPGWRWVFFVNVPVGAVLIALAAAVLPRDRAVGATGAVLTDSTGAARGARRGFDTAGAVTVTAGLMLLVYAVSRSTDHGWTSASTLGLLAASAVALAAFGLVEARSRQPLVPRAVVRNRTLVAANMSAFFLFGAFFAFIFLGSLLMQEGLGYSPTRTGVAWLATTVPSFFAAAAAGGKLVQAVGVRRLMTVGFVLLAIAAFLLTRMPDGANYATDLLPGFALAGVAVGLSAPAAQIGALAGVEASMTGLAGGLVETLREIGGGVGVAVVGTVLASQVSPGAAGHAATPVTAFHDAFWVMFVVAVAGAVTTATVFPRRGVVPMSQDADVPRNGRATPAKSEAGV